MSRTVTKLGTSGGLSGAANDPPVDPEWQTWLDLLAITLDEASDPSWAVIEAATAEREAGAPLLHGAAVRLDARRAGNLVRALAKRIGMLAAGGLDPILLIRAAIERDDDVIARAAEHVGTSHDSLAVLAQFAATPLLHAAARSLDRGVAAVWQRGYCPVCGTWPALVEMRGIERERRLRCGCCAADWQLPVLRCAFCGELDHHLLGSLIPEGDEKQRRVETCESCHGYLKVVMTLGALPPLTLALQDLGTVPLDFVAQERGYERPSSPGWSVRMGHIA
ncbi:MAG TPA: formate dehydrogenase accessory protein FdhE [Gemmatimonadaceae bacterium]|nr:formate dehydrogenase accessory protein FdhE [Gemmatimonadaceae bacterium]